MNESLVTLVAAATKVFVWVQFGESTGAYIRVTKRALFEFLEEFEYPIELGPWFRLQDGELYLGRVASAPHISCDVCHGEQWITDSSGKIEQCSCAI